MSLFAQLPEDFLHHIWRTCNFDLHGLTTEGGATVFIRKPGIWNHNQGPDFLDARLSIDGMDWHGQVELHVHSQDWYRHGHHLDKAYNNTILHVVLSSNGKQIFREDGTAIPELVLDKRISPNLLTRYRQLQLDEATIPCQAQVHKVSPEIIKAALRKTATERIYQKVRNMEERLIEKVQDWEQVLWEEILSMMGGPVNRIVFRELAQRVPIKKLRKQQHTLIELEAMLLGAAGMLPTHIAKEGYVWELAETWRFLSTKLKLEVPYPLDIRFMRMRPASFPGIRIAQAAQLLQTFPLLTHLLSQEGLTTFRETSLKASEYWDTHYRLLEESKPKPKQLGTQQKALLITNCLLPMALIYQKAHGKLHTSTFIEQALAPLPKEKNKITKRYEALHWENTHALASQGMIQLSKFYCQERRCLHCEIGKEILA